MTKIMYLNPVAHQMANDRIFAAMAQTYKNSETEVHVVSLPNDVGRFSHIEYRSYEGLVTAGIIRATRQAAQEGFDALVIGCFYDTALSEAREVSGEMFVTAPCAASCEIAASLSNRFGIIVGRRKWVHQMQSTVNALGYGGQVSGFYQVGLGVNAFHKDRQETEKRLLAAGAHAVSRDFAEALVLGCTMEIGFYQQLETKLGIPVIDPSIAALKRAEYGAALRQSCGWKPSRKWSCEAPPEAEIAHIGALDTGEAFGGRIIVGAG